MDRKRNMNKVNAEAKEHMLLSFQKQAIDQ